MAVKNTTNNQEPITKNQFGKIGVLMGGTSTEREISLKSGKAVYESLTAAGLDTISVDIKTDRRNENMRLIEDNNISCAFLALHGRFGEDGQIQEILEELRIPYTGSGVSASKLAMDKVASREVFEANGLHTPKYNEIDKASYQYIASNNNFEFPLVIKPVTQGSSIGLSIIDRKEDLNKALDLAFQFDERVIIEEYISGREMTVGILDNMALPIIEIVPKKRFFDYEAKYQVGMTDYIVPARINEQTVALIQKAALSAHKLLGCYGCSRVDMILGRDDILFILEVNTIPGMTQNSLLPKAARVAGIDFSALCVKLIKLAYEKI